MVSECTIVSKYVDIQLMPGAMREFKSGRDGKDRVVIREAGVNGWK